MRKGAKIMRKSFYESKLNSLDKKDLHEALEIAKDRAENEETDGPRKKWQSVVNHLESKIKVAR